MKIDIYQFRDYFNFDLFLSNQVYLKNIGIFIS